MVARVIVSLASGSFRFGDPANPDWRSAPGPARMPTSPKGCRHETPRTSQRFVYI